MQIWCSLSSLARLVFWIFVLALFLGIVAAGNLAGPRFMPPAAACELDDSIGEEAC